jgi:hypothetical protein
VDSNIPIAVFLGLHLLVTDPATSPRSNIGKAIFGSLYGLGVWLSYAVLRQFGLPEFYDKLLVVPILNLGVQLLDHLAAWQPLREFGCWETGFGLRKLNAIHMGCWGLIFMAMLGTGFVEAPQPGMSIAFWQKAAEEGRPHAAENLITKLTFLSYQGVGDACRELGQIYAEGRLTKGDPAASARFYAQAREIYTKGCAQGEPIACRSLAQMELAGEGGPQDPAAAERTLAMLVPPSHLLDPGLMRKMRLVLARFGKDVDMDPGLSARMGFTGDNQPWMTRQVAGSVPAQPGNRHSFSMSRDDNQPDILIGLHTTTRLYIVRSHPDGTSVPGYALVTDAQSGRTLPLSADEAQACLNEEFDFWSRIADQLLSTPSQK